MLDPDCSCCVPGAAGLQPVREVGVDETNGRFATVTLLRCGRCDQHWVRYFVEFEDQPSSGRWARAQVEPDDVPLPEGVPSYIARRNPVIAGGSHFGVEHQRFRPINWEH